MYPYCSKIYFLSELINKEAKSLFSLTLKSTTYRIDNICLLHEWLKKTKIMTKASYIVNSTYNDQCMSCNISIACPSGEGNGHWERGGGDISKDRDSLRTFCISFFFKKKKPYLNPVLKCTGSQWGFMK